MEKFHSFIWLVGILIFAASPAPAQQPMDIGLFEKNTDIGAVQNAGSASYDPESQIYTLKGSGQNMWFDQDQFHYLYKEISGDFILRTRAAFVGEGVEPHRKMGWIVREALDPSSAHVNAAVHGNGLTSLQFRRAEGGATEEVQSSIEAPDVIQLERQGDTFIMSVAQFGEPFTTTEISDVDLPDEVYVGLYVCAHNPEVTEEARFRNVRIVKPVWEGLVPYRDYLGSNLEVMEVETGYRKILYRSPESLQAPNWTPDGSKLIYNHNGLLYNYDLEEDRPEILDTDFAINNNNDHVLTFDGTMLGISNHTADAGGASIIYTMPADGGEPKRVTEKGPSYFHGWSPNNKHMVYTAQRNGEFDIYRISPNGGTEERLTTGPGLDDGPEYTRDGRYIYFNSTRTGSMEIWRMKPDGSDPEQLTDDRLNNWFPHISPDGKQVVFISFPESVDPADHPFYKRVYLRIMPLDGGEPRVIAYLYGGQGTMNVPSWSPDGKHISFVSNSDGIE